MFSFLLTLNIKMATQKFTDLWKVFIRLYQVLVVAMWNLPVACRVFPGSARASLAAECGLLPSCGMGALECGLSN